MKIKATAKMLRDFCCDSGLEQYRALLPATLSTEPEENIETALAVVDMRGYSISALSGAGERSTGLLTDFENELGWQAIRKEPYVVAQFLASVADDLLVARGR